MTEKEYKKIRAEYEHFKRGGLPALGKPHAKAGYRWMAGVAKDQNGKVDRWRENLGSDLLVAQYRARAMSLIWFNHVLEDLHLGAYETGLEAIDLNAEVEPLDKREAKSEAWVNALEAMNEPARLAAEANKLLQKGDHPKSDEVLSGQLSVSPGFKLVAVPIDTGPMDVIDKAAELESKKSPATVRTLHSESRRWSAYLEDREAKGLASDSYTDRYVRIMKEFRSIIVDHPIDGLTRQQLEDIRHKVQTNPKKNGNRRRRDTTRTELGCVRAFFQFLIDDQVWTPVPNWVRWLRADFRNDDYDDDGAETKLLRYSIDELTKIYAASGNTCRLYILLGLNFAWGAKEQSTAKKAHFKDKGKRLVRRFRNKRHPGAKPVLGRWIAWPETWKLAKLKMERTTENPALNPKGLAFMSVQNQPLVRYQVGVRSKKRKRYSVIDDAIREACKKAGVEFRGVYAIRKTGINLMRKIGKRGVARLYCQHTSKLMIEKHYLSKRWRKMWQSLEAMRAQLQPMFEATTNRKSAGIDELTKIQS